jgi:hypothetical protein
MEGRPRSRPPIPALPRPPTPPSGPSASTGCRGSNAGTPRRTSRRARSSAPNSSACAAASAFGRTRSRCGRRRGREQPDGERGADPARARRRADRVGRPEPLERGEVLRAARSRRSPSRSRSRSRRSSWRSRSRRREHVEDGTRRRHGDRRHDPPVTGTSSMPPRGRVTLRRLPTAPAAPRPARAGACWRRALAAPWNGPPSTRTRSPTCIPGACGSSDVGIRPAHTPNSSSLTSSAEGGGI